MKKRIKQSGSAIITLILLLCATPWIAMTIIGNLSGSFFTAFMNGFKKGTIAFAKIQIRLNYLKIKKEEQTNIELKKDEKLRK